MEVMSVKVTGKNWKTHGKKSFVEKAMKALKRRGREKKFFVRIQIMFLKISKKETDFIVEMKKWSAWKKQGEKDVLCESVVSECLM